MSGLRAAQRQLTRRLLLDSGLDLFETKGFAFTTVEDIASGAGTTRTTFYVHFQSKADLVKALIADLNDLLVSSDDPPLAKVIHSGQRVHIRAWIERKVQQWPDIRRCATVTHAAAAYDAEIAEAEKQWFEGAINDIHEGLDLADRFDANSRHARAALAFGQLELLSRRWFDAGWTVLIPQEISIDLLVDNWCWLLGT
jgi:AcrR family transcriptional regulator